jgi:hypothetical protein
MANRIQLRRDTAANWTRENPVLSQGEPGFDLTENKLKVGDGVTAWADLAYASGTTQGLIEFPEIDGTKTLWGAVDEDFTIKTTRTDPGSDADIGIYAADDLWLEALGDDVVITAANEVRIESNAENSTYEWQFGDDGNLTLPNGGVIKNYDGSNYGGGGSVTTSTLVNSTSTVSLGSDGKLTLPGDLELLSTKDIIKSGNRTALFKSSVTLAAMGAEGGGLLTAANFTIRTVNNTSTYTLTFASSTPTAYSWSGFGMDMSTGAPINVWGPKFTATATQDYTLGTFATVGDTFQIILTDYTTGYLYRITSVLTTTSSSSTTVERIA